MSIEEPKTCHIIVEDNFNETEGMGDVWLECDVCHWTMPFEPRIPDFDYCPHCGRPNCGQKVMVN